MEGAGAVVLVLLFSLLFALLLAVPGAVALIWLFGALNDAVSQAVPSLGYAECYPITLFAFWFWNLLTANSASGSSD